MNGATAPPVPNRDLSQVLHHFQIYAMNALGGPSLWNAEMAKLAGARFESYKAALTRSAKELAQQIPLDVTNLRMPLHSQTLPIMLRSDSRWELTHTILEGQKISCFKIGGEKRLCLPQLLQTVLDKLSWENIEQACDDLNIYCSRCNPEQLELFKKKGDLLQRADSCGLITLTDAERLCEVLLHSANDAQNNYMISNSASTRARASSSCIPVYHECFGEGHGYLKPDLYTAHDALCIECADCGDLLSPRRFVGHSHGFQESLICHWGFDRNNWRSYILFDEEAVGKSENTADLELIFNQTLQKYSETVSELNGQSTHQPSKRKISSSPIKSGVEEKFRKLSDSHVTSEDGAHRLYTSASTVAFPARPEWLLNSSAENEDENPSLVKTEPRVMPQTSRLPVLENPDSVVPSCQTDRYGKHFVPNISLQQNELYQSSEADSDCTATQRRKAGSKSSIDSGVAKTSNKSDFSDGVQVGRESSPYRSVLESLAKMENQYLQLLHSTVMTRVEKSELEEKYVSYSDTIRKHFAATASSEQYKEKKDET